MTKRNRFKVSARVSNAMWAVGLFLGPNGEIPWAAARGKDGRGISRAFTQVIGEVASQHMAEIEDFIVHAIQQAKADDQLDSIPLYKGSHGLEPVAAFCGERLTKALLALIEVGILDPSESYFVGTKSAAEFAVALNAPELADSMLSCLARRRINEILDPTPMASMESRPR